MTFQAGATRRRGRHGSTSIEPPFGKLRTATKCKAAGFTLIELLVVIAIIALLLSILLPALGRARRYMRTVKCATQLRGFGNASQMFANDNDGWLPRNDGNGLTEQVWSRRPPIGTFWGACFSPYLPNGLTYDMIKDDEDPRGRVQQWIKDNDFFRCPANEAAGTERGMDYAVNNFDFQYYRLHSDENDPYQQLRKEHAILAAGHMDFVAADVMYLGESSRLDFNFHDVHSPGHCTYDDQGQPAGDRMIRPSDDRHGGSCNIAFFDGHAETREMTPENFPFDVFVPYWDED
ncbi:MAG: prepilin-type N-terminal cleavage/methylation domain-containing protein [Phycisphaerae bacterium]